MSEQRSYQPPADEAAEFVRRLDAVIVWGLRQLGDEHGHDVALAVADLLDQGRWRLMTNVDVSRDGEPDIETLWYRVEVETKNGWIELCQARWDALGVSPESAADEAKWTALQNGIGVPDNLSGITDSPS